jgi:hypothetical protein
VKTIAARCVVRDVVEERAHSAGRARRMVKTIADCCVVRDVYLREGRNRRRKHS